MAATFTLAMACPAFTAGAAIFTVFNPGVRFIKRVPVLAKLLTRLPMSAVTDCVISIFGWCSPFKVFQPVVGGVAVEVPGNESIWTRSNKRLKNKVMHTFARLVVTEADAQSSIGKINVWFKDSFLEVPNSSQVGHFVAALVSDDRTPFFDKLGHVNSQSVGLILGAFAAPARFNLTGGRSCLA